MSHQDAALDVTMAHLQAGSEQAVEFAPHMTHTAEDVGPYEAAHERESPRHRLPFAGRITVQSHRLVYLTELDPSTVRQASAFRQKKPWLKNRSPLGDGIQLGGSNPRTTKNGLVLRPKTSLTYDIDRKFDFFVATIGIDSRSTGPAHAIFRVRDGDKILFESKPITRQSEPLPIKIAVDKVDRLTIEADFGKNFDFGDHCVFAEARVIKRGS